MLTTQKEIRQQFWQDNPNLSRKKIKTGSSAGLYHATTRSAFVDYVDHLHRQGTISDKLARRATL